MLFLAIALLLTVTTAVIGVKMTRPAPAPVAVPAAAPLDDEAVRRAAILARIRRVGVAPDDLGNLARFR